MAKVNKARREKSLDTVLDHFHPEAFNYGGWDIWVDRKEVDLDFIAKEFEGVVTIEPCDVNESKAYLRKVEDAKFKMSHTLRVVRYKAGVYKDEADRYHSGMKKLLEG